MRKLVVSVVLAASMAIGGSAWAQPPSEDPSGGNGRNGNRGCQGLERAPDTPGTRLAKLILGCEDNGNGNGNGE